MSKNALDSEGLAVRPLTTARIPTRDGEFQLTLYENSEDEKDHLALVHGDIHDETGVLVRIHSECFTGDVLGSLRCDCGEQLNAAMRMIADHGSGIVLYLRQEGRGIGLLSKLKAYNLQDKGYDTVDANLALGHGADERDYTIGAHILEDLGVSSVRLITNNPEKIEGLQEADLEVIERIPIQPLPNKHNLDYLHTKVDRMRHMMELGPEPQWSRPHVAVADQALRQRIKLHHKERDHRPFITLSYVQRLDGSISGPDTWHTPAEDSARRVLHRLGAVHDAILFDVDAVLTGDSASTRHSPDEASPRLIVLDPELRLPPTASMFGLEALSPIIATNERSRPDQVDALQNVGAHILQIPCDDTGISLHALLDRLKECGLHSVFVEGRAELIAGFMQQRLVDHMAILVTHQFTGGEGASRERPPSVAAAEAPAAELHTRLTDLSHRLLGEELLIQGRPVWEE